MKGCIPENIKIVHDDIPESIVVYAYSILNKLFESEGSFPKLPLSKIHLVRNPSNSSEKWLYKMKFEYNVKQDPTFYRNVREFISIKTNQEYVYLVGEVLITITLNNWKQHQVLSRIEELEQTVQEQSKLLNKMTIMLENIWMHESMPGGQDQKKKALESYQELKF